MTKSVTWCILQVRVVAVALLAWPHGVEELREGALRSREGPSCPPLKQRFFGCSLGAEEGSEEEAGSQCR